MGHNTPNDGACCRHFLGERMLSMTRASAITGTAAIALGLSGVLAGPASAAASPDAITKTIKEHRTGVGTPTVPVEAIPSPAVQTRQLIEQSGTKVLDMQFDASDELNGDQELSAVGAAVAKSQPDVVVFQGFTTNSTSDYMTMNGGFAIFIDSKGNGQPDFVLVTPAASMATNKPVAAVVYHADQYGELTEDTHVQATAIRYSSGYGLAVRYGDLGTKKIRYQGLLMNEAGDVDYAPNNGPSKVLDLSKQVVGTKPSAVRSVQVGYKKGGKAVVVWNRPAENVLTDLKYKVRITKKNSSKYGKWVTVSDPYRYFNLKKNGKYKVQVVAVNSHGSSPVKTVSVRPKK